MHLHAFFVSLIQGDNDCQEPSMSGWTKSPRPRLEESSKTGLRLLQITGTQTLVLCLIAAAITVGTIMCRVSWEPSTEVIPGVRDGGPEVKRSHKGVSRNRAEITSGRLVTGEEWDSVLQSRKIIMASYNITEESIQAFQAVSIMYVRM